MRVCLLTNAEAVQLEQQSKLPNCANHSHESFLQAMENVTNDVWRWVAGTYDMQSRRRVTPTPEIVGYSNQPCMIRNSHGQVEGVVYTKQAVLLR